MVFFGLIVLILRNYKNLNNIKNVLNIKISVLINIIIFLYIILTFKLNDISSNGEFITHTKKIEAFKILDFGSIYGVDLSGSKLSLSSVYYPNSHSVLAWLLSAVLGLNANTINYILLILYILIIFNSLYTLSSTPKSKVLSLIAILVFGALGGFYSYFTLMTPPSYLALATATVLMYLVKNLSVDKNRPWLIIGSIIFFSFFTHPLFLVYFLILYQFDKQILFRKIPNINLFIGLILATFSLIIINIQYCAVNIERILFLYNIQSEMCANRYEDLALQLDFNHFINRLITPVLIPSGHYADFEITTIGGALCLIILGILIYSQFRINPYLKSVFICSVLVMISLPSQLPGYELLKLLSLPIWFSPSRILILHKILFSYATASMAVNSILYVVKNSNFKFTRPGNLKLYSIFLRRI